MTRIQNSGGRSGSSLCLLLVALLAAFPAAAASPREPQPSLFVASSDGSSPSATGQDAGADDARPAPPNVVPAEPKTESLPVYNPPRRASPRALVGGGLRDARGLPAPLALAPAHLAETISVAPSLFWYVSAAPPAGTRVVLTIADPESVDPLAEVELPLPRRAGIQRVRLADHGVVLARDVEYEWAIALVVDPSSRARDQVATGYLRLVDEPAALRLFGRSPTTLASAGLWYDALAAVSDEIEARPGNARAREARNALLRQADLARAAE